MRLPAKSSRGGRSGGPKVSFSLEKRPSAPMEKLERLAADLAREWNEPL
jgi:hypothetical protein